MKAVGFLLSENGRTISLTREHISSYIQAHVNSGDFQISSRSFASEKELRDRFYVTELHRVAEGRQAVDNGVLPLGVSVLPSERCIRAARSLDWKLLNGQFIDKRNENRMIPARINISKQLIDDSLRTDTLVLNGETRLAAMEAKAKLDQEKKERKDFKQKRNNDKASAKALKLQSRQERLNQLVGSGFDLSFIMAHQQNISKYLTGNHPDTYTLEWAQGKLRALKLLTRRV
jgi:hypothetical protein